MPQIDIIIDTDGTVKIDAIGFSGGECEKATAELERALGIVMNKTKKKEFYNIEKQTNPNKNELKIK